MKIRKAKLKDCEEVYELCRFPWLLNPSWEPPKKWWIEAFVKEKQIFFVWEDNWKAIWFILWERTTWDIFYLWMIAVKKEYQWRWIWWKLLDLAQIEAKKRWMKVVVAYSFPGCNAINNMLKSRNFECWNNYTEQVKFL